MNTKSLFSVEDRILKMPGLYAMWSVLYWTNLYFLLTDSTVGSHRDFNVMVAVLSTLYCGGASLNNLYGNQLPSTLLLSIGPIHQYSYWTLFAYYGGSSAVLGDSGVAAMNWVHSIVVGLFTVDMVIKTWFTTCNLDKYVQYVVESKLTEVGDDVGDVVV